MSGPKVAQATFVETALERVEGQIRRAREQARGRALLARVGRALQESDTPRGRSRAHAERESLRALQEQLRADLRASPEREAELDRLAAAIQAKLAALAVASPEGLALASRLRGLLDADTALSRWRGEEARRLEATLQSALRRRVGAAQECERLRGELERLEREAEELERSSVHQRELLESFVGALEDLGFTLSDRQDPGEWRLATRRDGAVVRLRCVASDRVETVSTGLYDCAAEYGDLVRALGSRGVAACFETSTGPLGAPLQVDLPAPSPLRHLSMEGGHD